MYIIDAALYICIVAARVLKETSLPNILFIAALAILRVDR